MARLALGLPGLRRAAVSFPGGRALIVGFVLAVVLAVGVTPAFGHSCENASMAPPANWSPADGPVFRGHWVWLPSIGVPAQAWGFDPPAGYQAQLGGSLLNNSAMCKGMTTQRQTDHGVQTGCV